MYPPERSFTQTPPNSPGYSTESTDSLNGNSSQEQSQQPLDPIQEIRKFLDLIKRFNSCTSIEKDKHAMKLFRSWYWQPRQLIHTDAIVKMQKNAIKAVEEYLDMYPSEKLSCVTTEELYACFTPQSPAQFTLTAGFHLEQGSRKTMEDAHFIEKNFFGIFDGHGGIKVAELAVKHFKNSFHDLCQSMSIFAAFETLAKTIDDEARDSLYHLQGCTALVWHITPSLEIISGVAGDCRLDLLRNINGKWVMIPLTPMRNWTTMDALRAAYLQNNPDQFEEWVRTTNPNALRFPKTSMKNQGLNVSRGFGDHYWSGCSTREIEVRPKAVSSKMKISRLFGKPGDILIGRCDGVILSSNELITIVEQSAKEPESVIAKKIVDFALNQKKSTDNCTAVIVKIGLP